MGLVLVGLDYKTAPIALREQLYLGETRLHAALDKLHSAGLREVVIVSTCNRLEIYSVAENEAEGYRVMMDFLSTLQKRANDLPSHLYNMQGDAVARHLMRVASGLESQILGEEQILGQVSQALEQAQVAGTNGTILSRLFSAALHTGKRARNETDISHHTLSISHTAVLLIQQQISLSSPIQVLVIGAGQMAELAVKALQASHLHNIRLINRTDANAQRLAEMLNVRAVKWDNLSTALNEADVVIAATSSPQPLIRAEHLTDKSLVLVDIGLPRNIASDVRQLPHIQSYDIDDLQNIVEFHHRLRQFEIAPVEAIIDTELAVFIDWLRSRDIVPLITELRLHAETLAQAEIEQALRRLPEINAHEQEVITQMAHRIVNKLLHAPTVNLKSRATHDFHYDYAHAIRELFSLDDHQAIGHIHNE